MIGRRDLVTVVIDQRFVATPSGAYHVICRHFTSGQENVVCHPVVYRFL